MRYGDAGSATLAQSPAEQCVTRIAAGHFHRPAMLPTPPFHIYICLKAFHPEAAAERAHEASVARTFLASQMEIACHREQRLPHGVQGHEQRGGVGASADSHHYFSFYSAHGVGHAAFELPGRHRR